jgi:EmrB/QacA subfamily drug resistance transporter
MLMVILDGSVVTVALPSIQHDLGFSPGGLTWTINAYMIGFAGTLLFAGRLGDLIGRRRVFLGGLALFVAASMLCGLADGQAMLIAARFVQGLGGAATSAVSLGMIIMLFPEPRERGTAIGAFSFTGAAGAALGQVLGGVLTDALNWHWIFFVNAPIGVAALVLAVRFIAADRGLGLRTGADLPGAVLVTAGLMLAVYTIVETSRYGWVSVHTIGLAVVALALLGGFVVRQATAAAPLLPLRVLRSRAVSGANVVQVLTVSAMLGFQVTISLYLQQVRGYDAWGNGIALLPAALTIGTVALLLSARLNARFGEYRVLLTGLVLLVAGMALLARVPVHAVYLRDVLPTMLLVGGFGLVLSALTALGMSGAGADDAGAVSGLFNTTQQIGGAFGVAVLSTLAAGRATGLTADGAARATALTSGFHLAFGTGAGLLVTALVVAAVVLRPRAAARPYGTAPAPAPAAQAAEATETAT